ncbi:hypothetical protein [Kribbella sp. NPDC049227]|uniref:hypothetical protein n=1 Tax=Kribbella sp. NPDC049227 TaxID=3364113 RepID=UPI00371BD122
MMLAEPALLFGRFEQDSLTKGGARERFQMLVSDLVKVQHPLASTVEGSGGRDWGIDTYVGQLSPGDEIFVWQSKFILEWLDKTPQGQIRDSFKQIIKQAELNGFTLRSWTLCVPCDLPPDQQKWFDGWSAKMRRDHGVRVSLWNGTELRHQLMREDAHHVRAEYLPHTVPPTLTGVESAQPTAPVLTTDDYQQFDSALFVRQLEAAGHGETDAARGLFFATEALFRDYTAKGDLSALAALEELHLDIHSIWESSFNSESHSADANGRMARLFALVMSGAEASPDPEQLRLRPVHKKGAVHRLVEAARAGWVTHWRQIALEHQGAEEDIAATAGETATAPVAAAAQTLVAVSQRTDAGPPVASADLTQGPSDQFAELRAPDGSSGVTDQAGSPGDSRG